MDERDEEFEELIERSSLGTPGARQLRRRTSRSQVDAVRRIVQLRNQMVHSSGPEAAAAAEALVQLLRELGYHGQAEQVLAEAFPDGEGNAVVQAAETIHNASAPAVGSTNVNQHVTKKMDLTAAVERYCELFNESVRTGDWAPLTARLTDDAQTAFANAPPPTDTISLEAVETLDQQTARAYFVWDQSGDEDVMVLRWREGRDAAIEVTFGAQITST